MDMVAEAKKREEWRADGSSIAVNGEFIAEACYRQDAPFIAKAPRFIAQQAETIERLQARLEAIYQAWLAIDSELDMGDHYVIKLEQYDALVETINPTKENA